MPDYEDMILQRQEEQEIFEDDPDYICNTCPWPNRGIPCGTEPEACRKMVAYASQVKGADDEHILK